MKTVRRAFAALLIAALLLALPFPTAIAAGSGTNLFLELDKTEAEAGEYVTVTVKNRAMKVCSFTGGVSFDPTKVVCTAVTPTNTKLTDTAGKTYDALRTSTTENAAAMNAVGFAFVSTTEREYRAGTLVTVTFRVIGKGTTGFTVYENSDGRDGFASEAAEATVFFCGGASSYLPGDRNIAPDAVASADSYGSREEGPSYPSNMLDGDQNTRWQTEKAGTTEDPAWAALTWENENTLDHTVIYWTSAHPVVNGFKLQISEDGKNWTDTEISVSRKTASNDRATDTVTLLEQPTTQYLRVYCFDNGEDGKYNPAIVEWEVYGTGAVAPAKPLDPTAANVTDRTITLTTVKGYEYRMGDGAWQTSPAFANLEPSTSYVFYQRVAATTAEEAGESSKGVSVKTEKDKGMLGDVDLDGEVGANDLTALARHVGNIEALTEPRALSNANVDKQDGVGANDLTTLARFVAGIITEF